MERIENYLYHHISIPGFIRMNTVLIAILSSLFGILLSSSPLRVYLPDAIAYRCHSLLYPKTSWIGLEVLTLVFSMISLCIYRSSRAVYRIDAISTTSLNAHLQPGDGDKLLDDDAQPMQAVNVIDEYHDEDTSPSAGFHHTSHLANAIDEDSDDITELDENGRVKSKSLLQGERDHYIQRYEQTLEMLSSYKTQLDECDARIAQATDSIRREHELALSQIRNKVVHAINAFNLSLSTTILNSASSPTLRMHHGHAPPDTPGHRTTSLSPAAAPPTRPRPTPFLATGGPTLHNQSISSAFNSLLNDFRSNASYINLSNASLHDISMHNTNTPSLSPLETLDQYDLTTPRIDVESTTSMSLPELIDLYIHSTSDKNHKTEAFANLLRVRLSHFASSKEMTVGAGHHNDTHSVRNVGMEMCHSPSLDTPEEDDGGDDDGDGVGGDIDDDNNDPHTSLLDTSLTHSLINHKVQASIQEERKAWEVERQALVDERASLVDKNLALTSEMNSLRHTHDQLCEEHQQLQEDHAHLQDEFTKMEQAARHLESECDYLLDLNDELQSKLTTVTELHRASQSHVNQLEDEVQTLSRHHAQSKHHRGLLSGSLIGSLRRQWSNSNDSHDGDGNGGDDDGDDDDGECSDSVDEYTGESHSNHKKDLIHQLEKRISSLSHENDRLQNSLHDAEDAARTSLAQLDTLTQELKVAKDSLDVERGKAEGLARQLAETTARIVTLEKTIKRLEDANQALEDQLATATHALHQRSFDDSISSSLHSDATALSHRYQEMENKLTYEQARADNLQESVHHLEDQVAVLKKQVSDLNLEKKRLHDTLFQESKVANQLRRENQSISDKLMNASFTSHIEDTPSKKHHDSMFNTSLVQYPHHHHSTMVGVNPFTTPPYHRSRRSTNTGIDNTVNTPFSRLVNDDMVSPPHHPARAAMSTTLHQDHIPIFNSSLPPPQQQAQQEQEQHPPPDRDGDQKRRHTIGTALQQPLHSVNTNLHAAGVPHPKRRSTTFLSQHPHSHPHHYGTFDHHTAFNTSSMPFHNRENLSSQHDAALFSPFHGTTKRTSDREPDSSEVGAQPHHPQPQQPIHDPTTATRHLHGPKISSQSPQLSYRPNSLPSSTPHAPTAPLGPSSVIPIAPLSRRSVDPNLFHSFPTPTPSTQQQQQQQQQGNASSRHSQQPSLLPSNPLPRHQQQQQQQGASQTLQQPPPPASRSSASLAAVLSTVDPTRPVAGCVISTVAPNSFAQAVGLEPQDVVLSIANTPTVNIMAFESARNSLQINTKIPIVIRRDAKIHTIFFTIDDAGHVIKDGVQGVPSMVKPQNKRHSTSSSSSTSVRIATNTFFDYEPYPPTA